MTHEAVVDELVEWFEDVTGTGGQVAVNAQCVVLGVPPRWGRTTTLQRFLAEIDSGANGPAMTLTIQGLDAPADPTIQAAWLKSACSSTAHVNRAARVLGVDSHADRFTTGLGLADATGMLGGRLGSIAAFIATLGIDALGASERTEHHRRVHAVERLALRIATTSYTVPVVIAVDDAELLDRTLLDRFVTMVLEPLKSRVLIVVACDPSNANCGVLTRPGRVGNVAERIHRMEIDESMDESHRRSLAERLRPAWPPAAAARLAERARDFADVFAATTAGGADMIEAAIAPQAAIDVLLDGVAERPRVSIGAAITAWLGGKLLTTTYESCLAVLAVADTPTPELRRTTRTVRIPDDPTQQRAERAADALLSHGQRQNVIDAVLHSAAIVAGGSTDVVEQITALDPVWLLVDRRDVVLDASIEPLMIVLVRAHLGVGDRGLACRVAERLLTACLERDGEPSAELIAVLDDAGSVRLREIGPPSAAGLEARVRHLAAMLTDPAQVDAALDALPDLQVALDATPAGEVLEWRLHLAYRLIAAGHVTPAGGVLAPLLSRPEGDRDRIDAEMLLYRSAEAGEHHIQYAALTDRYGTLPADAPVDERIAVVAALAHAADQIGDARTAHRFGAELVDLLTDVVGPHHRATLLARRDAAIWTGASGAAAHARDALHLLVDDVTTALGATHRLTLTMRMYAAIWTGEAGDSAAALAALRSVLPQQIAQFGLGGTDTLLTRRSIIRLMARWGQLREALSAMHELVPDEVRVFGASNRKVLQDRLLVAQWTGELGNPQAALAMVQAVLPELVRTLGPDHPETLRARNNLGGLFHRSGSREEALTLFRNLLRDGERVLGPEDRTILMTRLHLAVDEVDFGDVEHGRDLLETILRIQRRVLGTEHPDTLRTHDHLTGVVHRLDGPAAALAMLEPLLDTYARSLGPDNLYTLSARSRQARWTAESGDVRAAHHLASALLVDLRRVVGDDHEYTQSNRARLRSWAEQLNPLGAGRAHPTPD
ncbi:MAG: tetratricopeptide repeat protein [Acidimicrobiia bacterium]